MKTEKKEEREKERKKERKKNVSKGRKEAKRKKKKLRLIVLQAFISRRCKFSGQARPPNSHILTGPINQFLLGVEALETLCMLLQSA
jgi:hypothetical protein